MKLEEKTQCLEILNKLKSLAIEQIILNHFGPTDYEKKLIGEKYPVREFIRVLNKMLDNFLSELDSDGWQSLSPYSVEDASWLRTDLHQVHLYLSERNFNARLINGVDNLTSYQRRHNFWHRQSNVVMDDLEEIANQLNLKKEQYKLLINDFSDKEEDNEKRINDLAESISSKTKEFQKLTIHLEESTSALQKIREKAIEGKNEKKNLDEIIAAARKGSEEFGNRMEEERKKFDDFRKEKDEVLKQLSEKIHEITSSQKNWDDKLAFIAGKEDFIKAKENEINELTGFAVGASLFHTFQNRKKELAESVTFWRYAVAAIAASVIVMLFLIFYINPSTTANGTSWGIFALNSVKSLPAVILLYFAIRQYNKERSFQEEYAFKSSVALTINAYADKLSQEGNTGKDNLIIASVAKVYETPDSMKEKGAVISFRSKSLNDTMKTLTEAIKEFKK